MKTTKYLIRNTQTGMLFSRLMIAGGLDETRWSDDAWGFDNFDAAAEETFAISVCLDVHTEIVPYRENPC